MDSRTAVLLWLGLVALVMLHGFGAPPGTTRLPTDALLPSELQPAGPKTAGPEALPVLLVYGFQPLPGFRAPDLWKEVVDALAGHEHDPAERRQLASDHDLYVVPRTRGSRRAVYISDYALPFEPTVRDLRFYAARLAEEIAYIKDAEAAAKVQLIAFSMGALVARCYIEAADFAETADMPDAEEMRVSYGGDVDTLVTLAAPHHGAAFAALGPWFGPLPSQLDPQSPFLRTLNDGEDTGSALHPDVRYVSLAGQSCLGFGCSVRSDVDACRCECVDEALAWAGHDLVILMSSARLAGAENVACIGFDHVEMHKHPVIVEVLTGILDGEAAPSAVFATEELEAAAAR
jgi:hypothetical protein